MFVSVLQEVLAAWIVCSVISGTFSIKEMINVWNDYRYKDRPNATIFAMFITVITCALMGPIAIGIILHDLSNNQST